MTRRWIGVATAALPLHLLGAQRVEYGSMPLDWLCRRQAVAGSPTERTLLSLALARGVAVQTSLRPLASGDLTLTGAAVDSARCGGLWVRPTLQVWFNSSEAAPDRDGAVWQGRGLTTAATGGVAIQYGVLSVALRPLLFMSQNAGFEPEVGSRGPGDFRDPIYGNNIDLPYRFGTSTMWAINPGESHVRLGWKGIAAGVSTEGQQWGPAHFNPLVLSTDGPGIPRVFLDARAVDARIARLTASWQLGLLEESGYSSGPRRSRVSSSFMAAVRPAFLPGLEVGGSRFFHVRRDAGTFSFSSATLPFSGVLKNVSRDVAVGGYNQLASVFARVAPVGGNGEVYGELYREDHNSDFRDLALEPDHASAYVLGMRWARLSDAGLRSLTIEHANSRISHLVRFRTQGPIYTHTPIREGHTLLGQTLGSQFALGGRSSVIAFERASAATATDARLEVTTEAQTGEGGTSAGTPTGHFSVHGGHRRRLSGAAVYLWGRAVTGYGRYNRTNLAVGTSLYY